MVIYLATSNHGKAREFSELLHPFEVKVPQHYSAPDETGQSFMENALLKARALWSVLKKPVLADDSGLVVEALGGRPGIDSAHYAGLPPNPRANIEKVLAEMEGVKNRRAFFVCALACVLSEGEVLVVQAEVKGEITEEPRGQGGFGYDPIFRPEGTDLTFAEMSGEQKARFSHRGKAAKLILPSLTEHLLTLS